MQASSAWRPALLFFVVLPLTLLVSNGVRAEKIVEVENETTKVPVMHMPVGQEHDAVIDGLLIGQRETEAFEQMIKTMNDIKALFEQDSQLNYEAIQVLPTLDVSAFVDLLRRATAAKFELLARLVDDLAGGISRSAAIMIDDAQASLRGKFTTTTSTTTTTTTTSTTTTTTTTTAPP